MSITVLKKGILDTVQDAGRYGWQHLGINPNGVMDYIAAATANILAGNEVREAVLEMHFPAPVLQFNEQALIALSGADFDATINDIPVPINTSVIIAAGAVVRFKKYRTGARCYLAVQHGFKADPWLGSRSTNLLAKAGGFSGRALQQGDVIETKNISAFTTAENITFISSLHADVSAFYHNTAIGFTEGSAWGELDADSQGKFVSEKYTIGLQSNRMAYKLEKNKLGTKQPLEIVSAGVTKGAVQLLPGGDLLLLMADHQSTGGYPVIAHVISAHLHLLAQMQPGQQIQFEATTIQTAHELYIKQQQQLLQLKQVIRHALQIQRII